MARINTVDKFGKPVGFDQTSPFTERPSSFAIKPPTTPPPKSIGPPLSQPFKPRVEGPPLQGRPISAPAPGFQIEPTQIQGRPVSSPLQQFLSEGTRVIGPPGSVPGPTFGTEGTGVIGPPGTVPGFQVQPTGLIGPPGTQGGFQTFGDPTPLGGTQFPVTPPESISPFQTAGPPLPLFGDEGGEGVPGGDEGDQPDTRQQGGNTLDSAVEQILQAGRDFLGRDIPVDEIIRDFLTNGRFFAPVNVAFAINNIRNSAEAETFRNRPEEESGFTPDDKTGAEPPPGTDPNFFPNGFNQGSFLSFASGFPPTTQGLTALVQRLNQDPRFQGIKIVSKDSIQLGNGQIIDVIQNVTSGNGNWQWLPDTPGGGGDSGGGGGGEFRDLLLQFLGNREPFSSQLGGFTPTNLSGINAPPGFQAGTIPTDPLSTFQGSIFEFDDRGLGDETRSFISQLLQNPTFSDDVVNQLRERQKDTILSLGEQARQGTLQSGASRGVSGGGGVRGELADIAQAEAGDITGAFRDIDIGAATENRASQERALSQAEAILQASFGRQLAGQEFNAGEAFRQFESERVSERDLVDRFLAQQGLNQRQSESGLARFIAQNQARLGFGGLNLQNRGLELQELLGLRGQDLQALLGGAGLDLQSRGLDIQQLLGLSGLDLQRLIAEGQLDLDTKRFLSGG